MIEVTHVFETDLYGADPGVQQTLRKLYGSKRSGRIYIIATSQGEAKEIVSEMFTRNGYVPPKNLIVVPTHLVKKALRMVF